MPIITINHHRVHYQEMNPCGRETVVMIHGMLSNLSVYYFHIAPLIAEHYRVVLYDLRGHGRSERASTGYGLQSMSEDLLALADVLSLDTVHLVGYSFGGLVALKTALLAPDRIGKLAVIEAPDPADRDIVEVFAGFSREVLIDGIRYQAGQAGRWMGKRQLERNYDVYRFLLHETSFRSDTAADTDFLSEPGLRHIRKDALLIYGKNSACVSTGNRLWLKIPRSRLVFLEGDHNVPVQEPAGTANALGRFLGVRQHSEMVAF
ncbi:alpha/beta fold hydrolase [Dinghuibacter silviterrae]|uniref:Pimeloyl-ACP methyl ester carboxylesterase n=1 Tax=Dinghuibacter silviterrae TaxID=1539049 RepID=A0A4R8DNG6_9BACT|nr:alpha/beta hydrolase [Dinghuibacter silviterrae]TDW99255.1 pimeloyl-ACP methyl ester carboxylesterase [Dinghuibacter silviterrae]